jgi:hypothetical protein
MMAKEVQMTHDQREIHREKRVLEYAERIGNINKACRYFGVAGPSNIYRRHTQANAIDFIDYVVKKFPFRIRTIRTDRGHEFQALFHWHVADLGMEHFYNSDRPHGVHSGKTPYEALREKLS